MILTKYMHVSLPLRAFHTPNAMKMNEGAKCVQLNYGKEGYPQFAASGIFERSKYWLERRLTLTSTESRRWRLRRIY